MRHARDPPEARRRRRKKLIGPSPGSPAWDDGVYARAAAGQLPGRYGVTELFLVLRCGRRWAWADPLTVLSLPEHVRRTLYAADAIMDAEQMAKCPKGQMAK